MDKLYIIIESSNDFFDGFAENCEGVYGAGNTIEECKVNILEGIHLLKEKSSDIPEILKGDYEIIYKYDTASFLKRYSKILSLAGIEKITGINQRQLSHYLTGHRKPSKKTAEKIEKSIHYFAKELSQVYFV